jgi:catechol 2,3-dioxygenase-like lactoylglutathione lyase family enzyme
MEAGLLNIVFGCPDAPALASFYAELLGMRVIREDWLRIADDEETLPRLAFDELDDYRPPRWPDPEHPQQVHLDVTVGDLDRADDVVRRSGASPLQDRGHYRSYADPAGHPFCLYLDPEAGDRAGRLERVVFDCFSPRTLARFYQELLGMPTRTEDSAQRVVIARNNDDLPMLGFQHVSTYTGPRWPEPAYPQQIHLDIDVDDGEAAQALAERLGAIRLPDMGGSCPVYADPAAHPFCLCGPEQ